MIRSCYFSSEIGRRCEVFVEFSVLLLLVQMVVAESLLWLMAYYYF
jgi:hypothetical protein